MPVPFFDITRQNHAVEKEINRAVLSVINSGRYILGENVSALEKEFSAYTGTKYSVGVASGTDALHLALKAIGIKTGDEVILPAFTFVATAEAVCYCNAIPVFADIDLSTFNLDPRSVEQKISKKTKAILPVHLYGLSADMGPLLSLAKTYNLAVIEDCAQATGAEYNGKKVGALGNAGCFSFFPTKNLGCFGDGGMVTTNDEDLYQELKVLRAHGSRSTYHHDIIGFNSRLDELQAAILRAKLPHLDKYINARRQNADFYRKHLSHLDLPHEPNYAFHTYNQYTIKSNQRDKIISLLKSKNIGAMVYYPLALHLQKAFAYLNYKAEDLPNTIKAQEQVFSLPVFPELTPEELDEVATCLKSAV